MGPTSVCIHFGTLQISVQHKHKTIKKTTQWPIKPKQVSLNFECLKKITEAWSLCLYSKPQCVLSPKTTTGHRTPQTVLQKQGTCSYLHSWLLRGTLWPWLFHFKRSFKPLVFSLKYPSCGLRVWSNKTEHCSCLTANCSCLTVNCSSLSDQDVNHMCDSAQHSSHVVVAATR